jgi:hypothetical protein
MELLIYAILGWKASSMHICERLFTIPHSLCPSYDLVSWSLQHPRYICLPSYDREAVPDGSIYTSGCIFNPQDALCKILLRCCSQVGLMTKHDTHIRQFSSALEVLGNFSLRLHRIKSHAPKADGGGNKRYNEPSQAVDPRALASRQPLPAW